VSVLGTEIRMDNYFESYTTYIVEISIENIVQKIFIRFKQILEL